MFFALSVSFQSTSNCSSWFWFLCCCCAMSCCLCYPCLSSFFFAICCACLFISSNCLDHRVVFAFWICSFKYSHFEFMLILSFVHFVFTSLCCHLMIYLRIFDYKEPLLIGVLPVAIGLSVPASSLRLPREFWFLILCVFLFTFFQDLSVQLLLGISISLQIQLAFIRSVN